MAPPNIDFTIDPTVGGSVRYGALAGTTPAAGESFQLSFQVEFTDSDSKQTLSVRQRLMVCKGRVSSPHGTISGTFLETFAESLP